MSTVLHNAIRTFATASLAIAIAMSASAAEDGAVGSSSSGNFDITLEVNQAIIAKNFDDLPLTTTGAQAGQNIEGTEEICVGGVGLTSGYSVSLSSGNGASAGQYLLNNGVDTLEYNVGFADSAAAADGSAPGAGSDDVTGTFTNTSGLACNADNARIFVSIPAAQWESVSTTDDYSDTLTVTVTAI